MKIPKKKVKKVSKINITLILLSVLLVIGLFNVYLIYSAKDAVEVRIQEEIEKAKPAQISLTAIEGDYCPSCVDINTIVDFVSGSKKINVTSTQTKNYLDSDIQSKLIELGIERFPALIIEGNINQSQFLVKNLEQIGKKVNDNTYVFYPPQAPYTNKFGEIVGNVDVIALYSAVCDVCTNIEDLIGGIKNSEIQVNNIESIEINSVEGKELVSKYNIETVPAIIFSNEFKYYESMASGWEQGVGSIEEDGSYIPRTLSLPHFSIGENKVVGKITLTTISNNNCKDCFEPVEIYRSILGRIGIGAITVNELDLSSIEAQEIIIKYDLEKFPTMIVNGDTDMYPSLKKVWSEVGTIEDNNYIFRNVELLQLPYYDLNQGEISS